MVWDRGKTPDPACIPWRPSDTLKQGESHKVPVSPPGLNTRRGRQTETGPQGNEAPGRLGIDSFGRGNGTDRGNWEFSRSGLRPLAALRHSKNNRRDQRGPG